MRKSSNSLTSDGSAPFEREAISEEELDQVVGGLARAWTESLTSAAARREAPAGTAWGSPAPLEAE
jgi:hypothetical protein